MVSNCSVYGIPLYMILTFYPQAYAVSHIKKANNGNFNNVNPRGMETLEMYKKSCPGEAFARYERAKAAHANLMESASFFVGAILVGNMVGLSTYTLNAAVGVYLALRVAYIAVYINVTTRKYSFLRSALWIVSNFVLGFVFVKAGNKVAAQS